MTLAEKQLPGYVCSGHKGMRNQIRSCVVLRAHHFWHVKTSSYILAGCGYTLWHDRLTSNLNTWCYCQTVLSNVYSYGNEKLVYFFRLDTMQMINSSACNLDISFARETLRQSTHGTTPIPESMVYEQMSEYEEAISVFLVSRQFATCNIHWSDIHMTVAGILLKLWSYVYWTSMSKSPSAMFVCSWYSTVNSTASTAKTWNLNEYLGNRPNQSKASFGVTYPELWRQPPSPPMYLWQRLNQVFYLYVFL